MQMLEPATSVVKKLGGTGQVAKILGIHRTRVTNWKRPKEAGGTGGMIPMRHAATLLQHARQNQIDLSADELFPAIADP